MFQKIGTWQKQIDIDSQVSGDIQENQQQQQQNVNGNNIMTTDMTSKSTEKLADSTAEDTLLPNQLEKEKKAEKVESFLLDDSDSCRSSEGVEEKDADLSLLPQSQR